MKVKTPSEERKAAERKRELVGLFKALELFVAPESTRYAMHVAKFETVDGRFRVWATHGTSMILVELKPAAEQVIPGGFYFCPVALAQIKAGQALKPADGVEGHFPHCDRIYEQTTFAEVGVGSIRLGVDLLRDALTAIREIQRLQKVGSVRFYMPEKDNGHAIKIETKIISDLIERVSVLIMPITAE